MFLLVTLLGVDVRHAHRIAALCSLLPTFAYILLADAPLSAQRAGVMVAMFMSGVALGRRPHGLDCLGFAATTLLMSSPSALAGPGFQFSFGTVFALLVWSHRGSGPRQWLLSSAVASRASTPVQAWHFGTIVPCATVSNLLVTPLASALVIPAGLFSLFLAPLWPGSLVVAAHLAEMLVAFTESIADLMGRMDYRALGDPTLSITLCTRADHPEARQSCCHFFSSGEHCGLEQAAR